MTELKEIFEKYHYPGKDKFTRILKKLGVIATTKDIETFLNAQSINQTFNEPRKVEGHTVSFSYLDRVQMDIIDMSKFYATNSHFNYLLIIIDIFSRFIWVYALKSKNIENVETVLDKFVEKNKPNIIITDNESSFISGKIQKKLESYHIKHITADPGDHKVLGVVDRVCRTIKVIIYKYMKENHTTKYLKHLPDIIDSYNNTPHSSIFNLTPEEATKKENYQKIFELNLEKGINNNKHRNSFSEGDNVRVRNKKKQFERAYDDKYGDVKTIKELGKKRAVLDDGQSVDLRRLKKILYVTPSPLHTKPDALQQAIKNSKVKKSRLLSQIADFNAKGKSEIKNDGPTLRRKK
jgi:hypothetical protein